MLNRGKIGFTKTERELAVSYFEIGSDIEYTSLEVAEAEGWDYQLIKELDFGVEDIDLKEEW